MKSSRLLLALFLLAPLGTRAAEPTSQAGLSGAVPQGVLRDTLQNGLRVVIVPDHLAPVVSTALNYLVGSNDAPPGFPGTAHALEHMMFRGSASLDRDQLSELGAQIGNNYNASTAETLTQYTFTAPARDLPIVLQIEAGRMRGLNLTEADWVQERGAIEQEVSRDLSMPFYNFLAAAQSILFAGTPYEHDALGTRPSFDATTAAELRVFYDRWYAPNNAILVIAGDVDPAEAMKKVHEAFDAIPSRPIPEHAPIPATAITPQDIALTTNLPVGLASLTFRMPGLKASDFATADVLGDILGSERGALYALVPAGRALSAQFSYQAKTDVGLGLAIAAFPAGEDPKPIIADMRKVLADIAANGVPPDLVEASKRQELAQLAFENDSIGGLSRIWSRTIATAGMNSPEDLAQAYAAVTLAGVNRLAKELLDPARTVTAILTPEPGGRPASGPGFGTAESFAAPPPDHAIVLPTWATEALAAPAPPDHVDPPTITMLPNGLRLIVQPEHVSRTVSVYGQVREVSETEEPAGKEGVSGLANRLIDEGTTTRDRIAVQKDMDDIAAQHQAGFTFNLKVLTPQFEPGMRLLADIELNPAFPDAAFAVTRAQAQQRLAGTLRSPGYRTGRALDQSLLPANDPGLREPTPASLAAITPEDVRTYWRTAFRPDLATIIVLGDTTPEEARRVVEQTFGAWTTPGPTPAIDPPAIPVNVTTTARIPDPSSVQDGVTLGEQLTIPLLGPDRYPLMLGNTILGSGFSSRLYRDLRVRTGYVYSVGSSLDFSRTRTRHTVRFGADPVNVDAARVLVQRNLRDMQTTPVTDAELARAKSQVLRQLPMQRASIAAIASLYLRLADLGLPMDTPEHLAQLYASITAEQIQHAFATWIHPDDLVQVVQGPPAAN